MPKDIDPCAPDESVVYDETPPPPYRTSRRGEPRPSLDQSANPYLTFVGRALSALAGKGPAHQPRPDWFATLLQRQRDLDRHGSLHLEQRVEVLCLHRVGHFLRMAERHRRQNRQVICFSAALALCCAPRRGTQARRVALATMASVPGLPSALSSLVGKLEAGALDPTADRSEILSTLGGVFSAPAAAGGEPPRHRGKLLTRWRDICDAIGVPADQSRSVRKLNESSEGPIRSWGRGRPVECWEEELKEWWADRERVHRGAEERRRSKDAEFSRENLKPYGSRGEVIASADDYAAYTVKERPNYSGKLGKERQTGTKKT